MEFIDAVSHEVARKLRWMVSSTSVLPEGDGFDNGDASEGGGGDGRGATASSGLPFGLAASFRGGQQGRQEHAVSLPPRRASSVAAPTSPQRGSVALATAVQKAPPTTKQRFAAMFLCAVFDGDCVVVRRMLDFLHRRTSVDIAQFLDQDEVVPFLSSPFQVMHYAVASRSTAMLQLLLFFESDVKKVTGVVDVGGVSAAPHSCTPLHMAIALADFEMVRTLLAAGAKARALRGPLCRRVSALQDALHALAEQNASALDACVSAPVEPLYSREGLTTPTRRPKNAKAPWLVWVRHGEEERAKIPRGAWRTDTNSFVRNRTPVHCPHQQQQQDPFDLSGTSAVAALTADHVSSRGEEEEEEHARSSAIMPSHNHSHPHERMLATLRKSSLFHIAVLLLDQGAEMIFQKSGLNHTQLRRLQQTTSAVQRELHILLVRREDTGLSCVIGEDAEANQRKQQQKAEREEAQGDGGNALFAPQDYDDDDDEGGAGGRSSEDRTGDDKDAGAPDPSLRRGNDRTAKHSKSRTHRRAVSTSPTKGERVRPMARLIESVTPCHERYIGHVLAARVRHHHGDRMAMLAVRGPRLLLPPLPQRRAAATTDGVGAVGAARCAPTSIKVGSAVWVLPASRYFPARRPMDTLVRGSTATPLLRRAGQPLLRNRYAMSRAVAGTNALLLSMSRTLPSRHLGTKEDHPMGDDLPNTTTTPIAGASSFRRQRSTTSMAACDSMRSVGSGSMGAPDAAATSFGHTMTSNASFDIRITSTTGEDLAMAASGAVQMTRQLSTIGAHEGGGGAAGMLPPLALHDDDAYGGSSPCLDASIVHVTETSQLRSSNRSAVFSQAMMVGDPTAVVGCVACIVMLPDRASTALRDALDAATEGAWDDGYDSDRDAEDGKPMQQERARRRPFAGIVVEPMYGAADGSLEASHRPPHDGSDDLATAGSAMGDGRRGGPLAKAASSATSVGFGLQSASSPTAASAASLRGTTGEGEDGPLSQTLPYCALFVPLADLMLVEQQAAVELVEHRLRKQLQVVQHALGYTQSSTVAAAASTAGAVRSVHRERRVRDPHKDMLRCIERERAADNAKDTQTAARRQGRM